MLIYFNGNKAKFTGKSEEKYGKTWYEYELLEGHLKGKTRLVAPEKHAMAFSEAA